LTVYRYTKALTNIKDIRKEKATELKGEKIKLDHMQKDKVRADALRKRLKDSVKQYQTKKEQHQKLGEEYQRLVQENKLIKEKGSTFRDEYQRYDALEKRQKDLGDILEDLEKGLVVMNGTFSVPHSAALLTYLLQSLIRTYKQSKRI
jgi:DNA repair protein RAD50